MKSSFQVGKRVRATEGRQIAEGVRSALIAKYEGEGFYLVRHGSADRAGGVIVHEDDVELDAPEAPAPVG